MFDIGRVEVWVCEHTFPGGQFYRAMSFPEGVRRAMVVVFHLGVEVDLQHFSNFLPVHGGHGETDGFPPNRSLIQGQEDCYAIG